MKILSVIGKIMAIFALCGLASSAFAQWQLDGSKSSVGFISTKNTAVAEAHSFGTVAGSIGETGKVEVSIGLDSVETLIPIRNERLRETLFETTRFPQATVVAQVNEAIIAQAVSGEPVLTDISITLSLHGHEQALTATVLVVATPSGHLLVSTSKPILVNAADYGLDKGIKMLQEIAGLGSISTAVPVSFYLLFVPAG